MVLGLHLPKAMARDWIVGPRRGAFLDRAMRIAELEVTSGPDYELVRLSPQEQPAYKAATG